MNQVVVIGKIDAGSEDHVGTLAEQTPNLRALMLKVQSFPKLFPPDIQVETISRSRFQNEAPEQQKKLVELALFNVMWVNIQVLQKNQPMMTPEEGLSRLRLAEHLARVNLTTHFTDREPICKTEKEALEKEVNLVSKWGSQAALFWEVARGIRNIDRYPRLKERVFEGLEPIMERIEKECFSELDLEVQAVFFQKAKQLTRHLPSFIKDLFISWIKSDKIEIADQDDSKEQEVQRHPTSSIQDVNALMDAARGDA